MTELSCYVALGSNLQHPIQQVTQGIEHIKELPECALVASSSLYQTPPWGFTAQPDFINAVVHIQTSLAAPVLLQYLQQIEQTHARQPTRRWGPRTLDIDILLYGNQIINTPSLMIPHPRMLQRDFVLIPLLEIAPYLVLPQGKLLRSYRHTSTAQPYKKLTTHACC